MDVPCKLALLLMDIEEFQSWTVWIQVTQVNGIAMSETHSIEHLAILIKGCRTPDDLVATVAVDISEREIVVTIGIHRISA